MTLEAIKREWLEQVALSARQNLEKYDADYAAASFLRPDGWTLMQLKIGDNGSPESAALKNGDLAILRFSSENTKILCQLTVFSSKGKDAWILFFHLVGERIVFDRVVVGSQPEQPLQVR